jgi:O-antigen ligase
VKWALAFYTMYVGIVLLGSGVETSPEKTAKFVEITWKIWLMSMIGVMLIDNQRKLTILMASVLLGSSWNAWELNRLYQYRGYFHVNGWTFAGLDSNVYSISTLPIACIALAFLMISKDTKWQLVAGFVMAMHMHQLMILESRGTMLGAVLAGILLVVFMPKNPRNWGMTVMILIVGGVLAGPPVVKEFMSSFQKGEDLDSSAGSRFELWKAGARIMMDYPVTGVGPWCGEL